MFVEERRSPHPARSPSNRRYYRFGERTIHPDGCVEVDTAYYAVLRGWIGQR
jgi:hypothetical protein